MKWVVATCPPFTTPPALVSIRSFAVCFCLFLHIFMHFDYYLNLSLVRFFLSFLGVFILISIHLKGCNSGGGIFSIIFFLFLTIFIWFASQYDGKCQLTSDYWKKKRRNKITTIFFCSPWQLQKFSLYGSCLPSVPWHVSCAPNLKCCLEPSDEVKHDFCSKHTQLEKEFPIREWEVLIDEGQTNL